MGNNMKRHRFLFGLVLATAACGMPDLDGATSATGKGEVPLVDGCPLAGAYSNDHTQLILGEDGRYVQWADQTTQSGRFTTALSGQALMLVRTPDGGQAQRMLAAFGSDDLGKRDCGSLQLGPTRILYQRQALAALPSSHSVGHARVSAAFKADRLDIFALYALAAHDLEVEVGDTELTGRERALSGLAAKFGAAGCSIKYQHNGINKPKTSSYYIDDYRCGDSALRATMYFEWIQDAWRLISLRLDLED